MQHIHQQHQNHKFTILCMQYLGSTVTRDGRCATEIKKIIAIAKKGFNNMKHLLTNPNIKLETRIRTLKAYIFSIITYGSETWTMNKAEKERIDAAEMWCLRRMLKIPWTAHITNLEVLRRAQTRKTLLETIRKRQVNFLGHVLRRQTNEHLVITGKIEGRRARGRQRTKYIQSLLEEIEGHTTATQFIQAAQDRARWKGMTVNVNDSTPR